MNIVVDTNILAYYWRIPLVTEDKRVLRNFPDTAVDMARLLQ